MSRRRDLLADLPPHRAAASTPILVVTLIWQFTNRLTGTTLPRGVRLGRRQQRPITRRSEQPGQHQQQVKEYHVDMAAALIAAPPTLFVVLVAGKFFVRGPDRRRRQGIKEIIMGALAIRDIRRAYKSRTPYRPVLRYQPRDRRSTSATFRPRASSPRRLNRRVHAAAMIGCGKSTR